MTATTPADSDEVSSQGRQARTDAAPHVPFFAGNPPPSSCTRLSDYHSRLYC